MSPKLKPLLLPQIVEDRRRRESMSEAETDLSSYFTQNSAPSEEPSPVTPTFSSRGHLRYPSSASSIESPLYPPSTDSPSSPTFTVPKSGKRSLPDVQEEPQEKDTEFEMLDDDYGDLYDCLCESSQCIHRDPSIVQSSIQLPMHLDFDDYDLADGFFSDGEYALSSRRKRRVPESPLSGMATRIGTKFPSFSRKWRLKKSPSLASMTSDLDLSVSRGPSSRSSSVSNSGRQALDSVYEAHMPPTPTKSVFGSREEISTLPLDIHRANQSPGDREEGFASTPLLPPLMTEASANRTTIVQSPLQSPSVADPQDPRSGTLTPLDGMIGQQVANVPSPPLSTKPSNSSFHRMAVNRPPHLIASSEILPIVIADENDEWSIKLGHANFTVQPEPYVPETFDLEACRQLRANWDLARCNYTKHLVRTGEHYGATSKTYKFTEEKWVATDNLWRKNNDLTIAKTVENSSEAFATLKHTPLGEPGSNNIMTKIPSLNDPRSGGKFPQLGDEDIVGPMVQAAAQLQRSPTKKAKLFRFFAEKFPAGLGRT